VGGGKKKKKKKGGICPPFLKKKDVCRIEKKKKDPRKKKGKSAFMERGNFVEGEVGGEDIGDRPTGEETNIWRGEKSFANLRGKQILQKRKCISAKEGGFVGAGGGGRGGERCLIPP